MSCELFQDNDSIGVNAENHSLETARLSLVPLQPHQLELSVVDYGKLQTVLGLRVVNTKLDDEIQYAMKVRLRKVLEDVENYLWLTNWAIVLKEQKQIVGFIMLKGYPNEFGEVIVGYGIDESYRRNGYATEALKGLTQWIFKNPKALFVIADTEKANISSHKVLENAGALKYKKTDELIWWRIERKNRFY
jgi:RimJ/RimL family protein N-acetyltransferase